RRRRDALRRGDRESAQAAGLDELQAGGDAAEDELRVAGDGVVESWPRAFVGDVNRLDLRHVEEQLAREVRDAARAGGGVGELVGLLARVLNEFLERLRGHRRMHG